MSKDMENKLAPRLRFTEFKNTEEWVSKKLDMLCKIITKGTTPTTLGYSYVNSGVNFIKIESIQNGKINLNKVAYIEEGCNEALKRSQLKEKDILFSIAGALGIVTQVEKSILPANTNQALAILRLNKDVNVSYVIKYLGSEKITNEVLKLKAGAAQPNISLSQLANFDILMPCSKEQEKIADCLSSLDDLINAETEKLDTLKEHKKGLSQQLFPTEGEKVPKLRFPEFEDKGDWEEKRLDDVSEKIQDGTHFSPPVSDFGDFLYITSKNVKNGYMELSTAQFVSKIEHDKIYKRCDVKKGDVLLTKDGTIGQACVNELFEEFSLLSSVSFVRPKSGYSNYFIYHLLVSIIGQKEINSQIAGQALKRITLTKIKNFHFLYPSLREQQKIADCLSSLDAQVTIQEKKIADLKLHKKGLMQGLFPI